MSIIEKKEKNLNQLINKLNSLSLSYSQPTYEVEKITAEASRAIFELYAIAFKEEYFSEAILILLVNSPVKFPLKKDKVCS